MSVTHDDAFVSVKHSVWNLDLPKAWVDNTRGLWDLFQRKISADELREGSRELQAVLTLLKAQGCLSYPDDKMAYTLREVKEIFLPICSEWYGRYYSHPLWAQLRAGSLFKNGLIAWLIHNYHLSRSAGITAARSATRLQRPEARQLFRQNVLEEYSHCHDYYFVHHPNLSIADEDVKAYVHLPSGLALEQQKLRIAETDWLAQVLFSYFQESTVRFYEQCKDFYRLVEERYGLSGFFEAWENHIQLDLDYNHVNCFSNCLDSDETCCAAELKRSLYNAWATFEFLLGCLDDILEQNTADPVIRLRLPIRNGIIDPSQTSLLKTPLQDDFSGMITDERCLSLYATLEQLGLTSRQNHHSQPSQLLSDDSRFLRKEIIDCFYKCVSYSETHDELMLFGRLIEQAGIESSTATGLQPCCPYTKAIANFFHERAIRPCEVALLLHHAFNLYSSEIGSGDAVWADSGHWLPLTRDGFPLLETFLAKRIVFSETKDRTINMILQFNELYETWVSRRGAAKRINFFCY